MEEKDTARKWSDDKLDMLLKGLLESEANGEPIEEPEEKWTARKVEQIMALDRMSNPVSLFTPVGDGSSHDETCLGEFIEDIETPNPEQVALEQDAADRLKKIMADILLPRERKVLTERFGLNDGEPKTLEHIGDNYGVTRERIRQIELQAFAKLKKYMIRKHLSFNDFY